MTRGRQQQQRQRPNRSHNENNTSSLIGTQVSVVQKQDQSTGHLTRGTVAEILTNSAFHPRGIKVRLTDGTVGRIASGQPGGATTIENYEEDAGDSSSRPAPSLADFMTFPSMTAPPQQVPASQPPPASDWACSACTFMNSGLLPECELCQTPR